ncbi:myelocytomatosis oncogene homolog isoform X1 [Alosa alosa]|nr:myelocytomatosis oncogene homolog isoform X1 [Alosa alosa]
MHCTFNTLIHNIAPQSHQRNRKEITHFRLRCQDALGYTANMLQSFSPSHDWFSDSEPLLFDEEFCQSFMQSIPTPPQSPPLKTDLSKALSKEDQLELVSELLLEDQDFQLNWNCDFMHENAVAINKDHHTDVSDDCLWHIGEKSLDKLSVLSTSPLLSDIDTSIFEEIAGSTLVCHDAALENKCSEKEDFLLDSQEQNESSSDYGSLSAGGESSTSDSEEEIDVVTVRRSSTRSHHREQQEESRREQLRALKRCHLEIQQQHNYAAPRPSSPIRTEPHVSAHKRPRTSDSSQRLTLSGRGARGLSSRHSADIEDEEERRRTHNVMERQRRNELKNCFLRLRDHVPELSNNDKASKVVILKRARDSIRNLEVENKKLYSKMDKLRDRQDWLKSRLEQLRGI